MNSSNYSTTTLVEPTGPENGDKGSSANAKTESENLNAATSDPSVAQRPSGSSVPPRDWEASFVALQSTYGLDGQSPYPVNCQLHDDSSRRNKKSRGNSTSPWMLLKNRWCQRREPENTKKD